MRKSASSYLSLALVAIPALSWAANPCPPPQVSVQGGSSATTSCGSTGTSSNSYTTNFPLIEVPISEGGKWTNVGLDWTFVDTTAGLAYGTNGANDAYDDSYAHLSGFGADQTVQVTIHKASGISSSDTHEAEILLRWADSAHNARGYEVSINFLGSLNIVRWNGASGDFTVLGLDSGGSPGSISDGDVFKASISGSTIKVWLNGTQIAQAHDSTFSTGNPGIGFFKRTAGINTVFGFKSFTATSP
jgi:hypothetical protein